LEQPNSNRTRVGQKIRVLRAATAATEPGLVKKYARIGLETLHKLFVYLEKGGDVSA